MATFTVRLREVVFYSKTLEIEADDWEEAEKLAMDEFLSNGGKWEEEQSNGIEMETEEEEI